MRSLSLIVAASAVAAFPQQYQQPPTYGNPSSGNPGYGQPSGQKGESPEERQERSAAVKEMFEFAWNGYYKYAFPNDELQPVNNSFSNSRNGWGASAADALSTALVMEEGEIVNQIVNYVPSINWSVSKDDEPVSLFETTIRYLGGLLSGYDLLNGPLKNLVDDESKVKALLDQAQNLANNLSYAFDTPTGIPYNNLIFSNRSNTGDATNGLATIGTLVLEWTRLSDLTGDETYGQLAQRGESYLLNPQPLPFAEPFPGMVGSDVAIENGWNGGTDSFYEYLIKMFVYDSSRFGEYRDR